MADKAASVLARLKNKAKASSMDYQQCLQLFFQEEFLRKLGMSPYAQNFVLKGGLFIYTLTNFKSRATVDVDFLLRNLNGDLERMESIIDEILHVPTGNDFITFKAGKAEHIAVHRKYPGVSLQITGQIKNVRVPFIVDIGIDDIIVPNAEKRNIITQLEEFKSPEILTYSLESTIAEKLDAMIQRGSMNSRMKDFYDIYYLAHAFNFNGKRLQMAIRETLRHRGTTYGNDSFSQIKALKEDADMYIKWRHLLKTMNHMELNFDKVLEEICMFLEPVWDAMLAETEFQLFWESAEGQWKQKGVQ